MNGAIAVEVRGWAICEAPEMMVRELLGPAARQSSLSLAPVGWRVEDPLPPKQPVGPIHSLVTFESDEPLEVRIVPGSQGQPPPPEEAGHELISHIIGRGRALVLDARCWYHVPRGRGLRLRLWMYQPLARVS